MTIDRRLYNVVPEQRRLVSPLPGSRTIGVVSLVEYDVDSLAVVDEDVLSGPTIQQTRYLLPVGILEHLIIVIRYSNIRVPRCYLVNKQVRFPILPSRKLCNKSTTC